jgi:hypothetical protein
MEIVNENREKLLQVGEVDANAGFDFVNCVRVRGSAAAA